MSIVDISEIERPRKDIVERFYKLATPSISDVFGRHGTMSYEIKQLVPGTKLAGPAITAKCPAGSAAAVVRAIMIAKPGDVIVIDAQGNTSMAFWGGCLTNESMRRGIAGAIVDGAVRDIDEIRNLKFPLLARAVVPNQGTQAYVGDVNAPIQCGGMVVNPGDIIVADENGIVVVPRQRAERVLEDAEKKKKLEEKWRKDFHERKMSFLDIWNFPQQWKDVKKHYEDYIRGLREIK